MKKYKIYLFDFDGTLLNTFPALDYVFRYSFEQIGVPYDSNDLLEFSRQPLDRSYDKLQAPMEKWDEFIKNIDASLDHEAALKSNELYPETKEFIDYINKEKIYAGIVTSNNKKHVKEVFKEFDIPVHTFALYIGNKECHHFKPHPDPIIKALEHINYQGDLKDVVYIGDGLNDTISANAAGVQAILIDRDNIFPDKEEYIRIHSLMDLFK